MRNANDREHATLITLETRSRLMERARLESELAHAGDVAERLCALRAIKRVDLMLMELGAGRMPMERV